MYGDCAGSGVKQHVHTPFISLSLSLSLFRLECFVLVLASQFLTSCRSLYR